MTIKLLATQDYGGENIPAGAIVNVFDPVTEAALIAAKVALASTAAVTWTPQDRTYRPRYDVKVDPATGQAYDSRGVASRAPGAAVPLVARPWRIACFGDSRAHAIGTTDVLLIGGNANDMNPARTISWLVGSLGDAEWVASFGISGDPASNWSNNARSYGKTIQALIAGTGFRGGPVDACYIQYGINDMFAGTAAATVIAYLQGLCGALMGAGIRPILEAINPASAAAYGANAAAKLQATIDINVAMKAWIAQYPNQAVFADTWALLIDPATGYGRTDYTDGTHHTGSVLPQLTGKIIADAARSILPAKNALTYTSGSLLAPNLIDWAVAPPSYTSADFGNITISAPTWVNSSGPLGPYMELTATCTALNAGYATLRWEVPASLAAQAGARFPIAVGDEVQGSAYVYIDDGDGKPSGISNVMLRHRIYTDKFNGDGASATAGTSMLAVVDRRYTTPVFTSGLASSSLPAPAISQGYQLVLIVTFNAVGQRARIRMYAPSLRVVSVPGAQPSQPAAGASPYTYTNTTAVPQMVYVAGGNVSAISIARLGGALVTGATSGAFRLGQRDSLTITYTVAPTLTVVPDEPKAP